MNVISLTNLILIMLNPRRDEMGHMYIQTESLVKSDQEVAIMVTQLRAGNSNVICPLITTHIKLVYQVSKRFIDRIPNKKDGIISAGFLGLTQAVNKAMYTLTDTNIRPYIYKFIKGRIQTFIQTDHLINIPYDTFKKMADKDMAYEFMPLIIPIDEEELDCTNENEYLYADTEHDNVGEDTTKHKESFEELFKILALTMKEKEVIELLLDGNTHEEIGEILKKSRGYTWALMRTVKTRLQYTELALS